MLINASKYTKSLLMCQNCTGNYKKAVKKSFAVNKKNALAIIFTHKLHWQF
jgi:aspartate carbamoyltransferase regulatory subunit